MFVTRHAFINTITCGTSRVGGFRIQNDDKSIPEYSKQTQLVQRIEQTFKKPSKINEKNETRSIVQFRFI